MGELLRTTGDQYGLCRSWLAMPARTALPPPSPGDPSSSRSRASASPHTTTRESSPPVSITEPTHTTDLTCRARPQQLVTRIVAGLGTNRMRTLHNTMRQNDAYGCCSPEIKLPFDCGARDQQASEHLTCSTQGLNGRLQPHRLRVRATKDSRGSPKVPASSARGNRERCECA